MSGYSICLYFTYAIHPIRADPSGRAV